MAWSGGRRLADLVEEQRAAVGRLEEARLVAIGAGEGAADVAEELALEQRVRERGAVDRDEGALARGEPAWIGAREHLLAGAGLAGEQHGGVRAARAIDEREHVAHGGAARDQPGRRPVGATARIRLPALAPSTSDATSAESGRALGAARRVAPRRPPRPRRAAPPRWWCRVPAAAPARAACRARRRAGA